jgi:hypothetical protein
LTKEWDGIDRRKKVRRSDDELVCPFHDMKCSAIKQNEKDIKHIMEDFARKEDIQMLSEKIEAKAPTKWVLALASVPVLAVGIYLAITFNLFSTTNHQIEIINDKVSTIKTSVTRLETKLEAHDRGDQNP